MVDCACIFSYKNTEHRHVVSYKYSLPVTGGCCQLHTNICLQFSPVFIRFFRIFFLALELMKYWNNNQKLKAQIDAIDNHRLTEQSVLCNLAIKDNNNYIWNKTNKIQLVKCNSRNKYLVEYSVSYCMFTLV